MDKLICRNCRNVFGYKDTDAIKKHLSVEYSGKRYYYIKDIDKFINVKNLLWDIEKRDWKNDGLINDFLDEEGNTLVGLIECQIDDALSL
jgi:hypothetical protein